MVSGAFASPELVHDDPRRGSHATAGHDQPIMMRGLATGVVCREGGRWLGQSCAIQVAVLQPCFLELWQVL